MTTLLDDLTAAATKAGHEGLATLLEQLSTSSPRSPVEAAVLAGVVAVAKERGPELVDAAIAEARRILDPSGPTPPAYVGPTLSPQARADIADSALELEAQHRKTVLLYLDAAGSVLGKVLRAAVGL